MSLSHNIVMDTVVEVNIQFRFEKNNCIIFLFHRKQKWVIKNRSLSGDHSNIDSAFRMYTI